MATMATMATSGGGSVAQTPAPAWGPAISIVALVVANLVALLLNPALLRSCCGGWGHGRRHDDVGGGKRPNAVDADAAPPAHAPTRPPRRCRCAPVPFFASNVSEDAAQRARARTPPLPREFWGFDVLSPLDPLSSWLSSRSVCHAPGVAPTAGDVEATTPLPVWKPAAWLLLPLYLLAFGYFVMDVLLEVLWRLPKSGPPDNPYPQWLSYLTNWSITLLGMSGLLGALNTLRSCCCHRRRNGPSQGNNSDQPPPPPPPPVRWDPLSVSHLLVTEVAVTAAFFVTIFFWGGVVGLGEGGKDLDAVVYVAHAGNTGVALLLLLLTRVPMASPHFLALLWYATAYMIFAWIFGSTTGDWRYGLDWRKAGPAVAYVLVPVFCFFVFFFVAFGLASLREAVGRRLMAKMWRG